MNVFKLLVKSALRVFAKSKVLIIQLLVLVILGASVLGTVSLSNISLKQSYDNVAENGNMADLTVNDTKTDNNIVYNLDNLNIDNPLLLENKKPVANSTMAIFNPLMHSSINRALAINNAPSAQTDQLTGFYFSPGVGSSNLVKDKNGNYLSVNTTSPTANKWLPYAADIFSLYKNIASVNGNNQPYTDQELYNPDIYLTNPFSFVYNTNGNIEGMSTFGTARVDGFNDLLNTFLVSHGVLDTSNGDVSGTNYVMPFKQLNPQPDKINPVTINFFASPSQIPLPTQMITQENYATILNSELANFYTAYGNQKILDDFNQIINGLSNKNVNISNAEINTKYYAFNYDLIPNLTMNSSLVNDETANNLVNFVYKNIFDNGTIKPLYAQYLKYFKGEIKIPLIDYYTIQGNDSTNSVINAQAVKEMLEQTLQQLSKQLVDTAIPDIFKQFPELEKSYNNEFNLSNELNKLGLSYDFAQNINLSDPVNGNQYVVSQANLPTVQNPNPINKIVLNAGANLFPAQIVSSPPFSNLKEFINIQRGILFNGLQNADTEATKQKVYNIWMQLQIWIVYKDLMYANWQTKPGVLDSLTPYLKILSFQPTNYTDFVNNFYPTFIQLIRRFQLQNVIWNGYGYTVEASQSVVISNGAVFIPFNIVIIDKTSYFSIISTNFLKANEKTKAILPVAIARKALQLPYADPTLTMAEVNANPQNYSNHFIESPTTHKLTFYQDFLDWLNKISGKYKIDVNSQEYVILGSGLSPDFMYPILSSSQLLLDNNSSGIVYTNSAGFSRATEGVSGNVNSYVSIKYPPDLDFFQKQKILTDLNEFTKKVYGSNQVFKVNDSKQPNQLLYLRMNFSYNLRNTVLTITLIIGLIIALLSIFFIATLLRSIVKQNKTIFGVVIANGVKKTKLALAFFPFSLFPGVLAGILGYLFSFLLMPSLTSMVANYWAPVMFYQSIQWWMFIITPVIIVFILFTVLMIVILWTMRKKTTELLGLSSEFRMNWFIVNINRITTKFGAMGSFRITYMLGNVTRFLILTGIVTAFITLSSVFVGTVGTFKHALSYTSRNHQYTYAFDLYSPTTQGGYYSEIPFSQIGTTQQGLAPLYDVNSPNGFYGANYKEALAYPYGKDLYYTNLFLPSTNVASEIQGNIQFFANKIFSKVDLDVNLDLAGANINPWSFARAFAPPSIIALSDFYMQNLLTNAFNFFLYVQKHDLYSRYLNGVYNQPWTLNGSNISADIVKDQNSNWIFKKEKNSNGQLQWALNTSALVGAPTYQFNVRAVKLFVQLITLTQNALYKQWSIDNFGKVENYNYFLGSNILALDPGDETYTYLTSKIDAVNGSSLTKPINLQIDGIKPNSRFVILYDKKDQDLKPLLNEKPVLDSQSKQMIYPIIINEVVQKKYGLNIGDIIDTQTSNQLNRFILKYKNPNGTNTIKALFKVVGITTSKSSEAFYTNQVYANKILGYQKPTNWPNKEAEANYVPFNGYFTDSPDPAMISHFGSVYSPSGLSPATGLWTTDQSQMGGDMLMQIYRSWNRLDEIVGFDITKGLKNNTLQGAAGVFSRLINTFDSDTPIVISIQKANAKIATTIMGDTIDQTVHNVMTFISIALIPTLIIIIILLSSMIVVEAKRLIGLLKVLGYGNLSNTFSFLFVYLIVLFAGLGISIGLTYLFLYIFSFAIFSIFNIIIAPIAPWWIYISTFGFVGLIFFAIFLITYFRLRKINPAAAIATR